MMLDIPIAIAIIEKLLGGAGLAQESVEPLTEVELTLLSELHQRAASDLAESLALLVETQPVVTRPGEPARSCVRAARPAACCIGLEFDLTMQDAAGQYPHRHTSTRPTGQVANLHGDDSGSRLPGATPVGSEAALWRPPYASTTRPGLPPCRRPHARGTWWSSTTAPTNR